MPGEIWPILTCHGVRQGGVITFFGNGRFGCLERTEWHEHLFCDSAYENELIAGVGAGTPAMPIDLKPEAISGWHDVK